ncbi:Circadian clock protein kinase KaiC [uncultured archaeon]|nr:Circadian clock protein kinase KaiC [uncultured archaeon]
MEIGTESQKDSLKNKTGQEIIVDMGRSEFGRSASSGIVELDRLLDGGFPKGSVILLSGSSGSGKTIFSFQWLFEGVRNGENCIYLTLTESIPNMLKNLEGMTFFDKSAIEKDKLKLIDLRDYYGEKSSDYEILDFIREQVEKKGAKRICIDSITALAYNLDEKTKIRKFIFELGQSLSKQGCTTILTSEVTDKGKLSMYDVEEFISDSIVRIYRKTVKGETQRAMKIIKVRGKSHRSDELFFRITSDGIVVFPKLIYSLDYGAANERVSTGNLVLDKMLLGGIFRGSSTLITGSAGTGKSLTSMQFMSDGLNRGENCLYISFEESKGQVIRNAGAMGWDFDGFEKKGLLTFRCAYPNEKMLDEHLADIMAVAEKKKIKRCVVDSVSSILHSFSDDSLTAFTKSLNNSLKKSNITTFFTWATTNMLSASSPETALVSTLVDNIISLRYVEINGELQLILNIIKIRGSDHSKGLAKYQITGNGISIGGSMAGYEGIMTGVTRKVAASAEEKLESEFKTYLGPVGTSAFAELKAAGLKAETMLAYIDNLQKKGIIDQRDAEAFRANVREIIGEGKKKD